MSTAATLKPTTIRIDESLKKQATDILDSIGLGLNAYLNLAVRQLVNQRRIPFELAAAPEVPNEETRQAMVAAEAKAMGLIPDDSVSFTDVKEMMAFLDRE